MRLDAYHDTPSPAPASPKPRRRFSLAYWSVASLACFFASTVFLASAGADEKPANVADESRRIMITANLGRYVAAHGPREGLPALDAELQRAIESIDPDIWVDLGGWSSPELPRRANFLLNASETPYSWGAMPLLAKNGAESLFLDARDKRLPLEALDYIRQELAGPEVVPAGSATTTTPAIQPTDADDQNEEGRSVNSSQVHGLGIVHLFNTEYRPVVFAADAKGFDDGTWALGELKKVWLDERPPFRLAGIDPMSISLERLGSILGGSPSSISTRVAYPPEGMEYGTWGALDWMTEGVTIAEGSYTREGAASGQQFAVMGLRLSYSYSDHSMEVWFVVPERDDAHTEIFGALNWTDGPADVPALKESLDYHLSGSGPPKLVNLNTGPWDEFGTPNGEFMELILAARWFRDQVAD